VLKFVEKGDEANTQEGFFWLRAFGYRVGIIRFDDTFVTGDKQSISRILRLPFKFDWLRYQNEYSTCIKNQVGLEVAHLLLTKRITAQDEKVTTAQPKPVYT